MKYKVLVETKKKRKELKFSADSIVDMYSKAAKTKGFIRVISYEEKAK